MGKIVVSNVGKAYKNYPNRWSRLLEWFVPRIRLQHVQQWILRDINFEILPGEAIGLVGINGAGKSTLLKMLTGTTLPTEGNIQISGRVAALLELGMGFHSEFTGRQNAYMSGQLLGLSVEELKKLMPKIIEFAEIGEYIDQPIRVYSSGMQVRLAFSVATAIRPDVLIIDEALSVGDAYFQHKSYARIRDFREKGTTLLIVSHDKQAIQSICNRAILLNAGRLEMEGKPSMVMDYYNALLSDRKNENTEIIQTKKNKSQVVSGSGDVTLLDAALIDVDKQCLDVISVAQYVTLNINILVRKAVPELVVGFSIKDRLGQVVFGTNTHHLERILTDLNEGQKIELDFGFRANFGPGTYSVSVALHEGVTHIGKNYEWRDNECFFTVINKDKPIFEGMNWLEQDVKIRHLK